ncbi:MAG: hypothetical protein K940chlam3_00387 [Chlamydiae bacterium]|nr:hypothetical protein [Chlamydiota bacterium]
MVKVWIFFIALFPFVLEGQNIPRTVITFYDSKRVSDSYFSRAHQLAEMPCNHLGLIFDYYDIQEPLPDLSDREDVIGILTWFEDDTKLTYEQGLNFFNWSIDALDKGMKYVVMGKVIFHPDVFSLPINVFNQFWEKLGMRITGDWVDSTFQVRLKRLVPSMTDFERKYPSSLTEYVEVIQVSEEAKCFLEATSKEREYPTTCLITSSHNGGYVANGYAIYFLFEKGKISRNWYINPFLFFRKVFGTDTIPKPDTTTVAGRRIYYSQVDGDGWNNQTEIGDYPWGTISAIVLYDNIYKLYPDLPVTVSPIGAEVDPKWVGLKASQKIARKIFELPHVEMSSHTFTHPFDWAFFDDYMPEDEVPYLHMYPNGSWLGKGLVVRLRRIFADEGYLIKEDDTIEDEEVLGQLRQTKTFDDVYDVPRAYALEPFNLDLEISGSRNLIDTLSPGDKKVVLLQWSGDCRPFYSALKMVNDVGLLNINGGDSRFDNVYPSYAWVAPLGREVDGLRQIYSSNANENLYTNLWRSNFFGFNLLTQTFENTEKPIRIRPANLYYHVYSGQKNSSLNALKQNLEYVRTHEVTPIKASEFSQIAEGFYSTEIEEIGPNTWSFCCRGALQTIRFDQAGLLTVNYSKSEGVIGHRLFQGSLYVYLDSAYEDDAVISLKEHTQFHDIPIESRYYLIHSRWQVFDLDRSVSGQISFDAVGYGPGEMSWNVPQEGSYEVATEDGFRILVPSKNRKIDFVIDESAIDPISIKIRRVKET